MLYDEPVFRPPSEASSLILQVTIGCSHNACTFCDMYKGKHFRIKEWEAIQKDIEEASQYAIHTKRIFLADGNALSMPTEIIFHLLNLLYTTFPQLQRVTAYAGPKDILNKNFDELKQLRKAGLTILYMGIESGHDPILQSVHKGVSSQEMQEAGQKALETGFALSVTIINGLGGKEKSQEHAVDTAKLLSACLLYTSFA